MKVLEAKFFCSKFMQWWLLLPLCFLFFTLQLSWLHSSVFTPFLPLVSCSGFFLSIVYRTKGLVIAYSFLLFVVLYFYQELQPEENLWQMGIIFTLAVDFFIALLLIEWSDEERIIIEKKSEEQEKNLIDNKEHYLQEERKYREYIDSLKEGIQELIRDAEQRRIDRVREQGLLRDEIKAMTEQQHMLTEELHRTKVALQESRLRYDEAMPAPKAEVLVIPDEALERQYKQIRKQFEEKSLILDKTRQELFATQTELLGWQRQDVKDEEELWHWVVSVLKALTEEQARLEAEVALLEKII